MRYKISLNNKESVHVDEEGYQKLVSNINSNFVELNGEIINPAYIVAITKEPLLDFDSSSSAIYREEPKKIKGRIDYEKRMYVIENNETK